MVALAGIALALLTASIDVTARPEDTRCPSRAAVAAALEGRVPAAAARWSLRYRVEARAEPAPDNHVWLELRDGEGELRLRRELSIADDGCEAAADGLALIVARVFREVSWTGAVPLPDMERAPEPVPAAATAGSQPFELQIGAALRREVSTSPGLALALRLPFGLAWLLDLGLIVQPWPVSQAIAAGRARLWSLPVRVSFRRRLARGPLGLEVGPELTVAVERATVTAGGIGGGTRAFLAGGVVTSARWAFARGWTFALDFSGGVRLLAPAFGTGTEVILVPQRVQLLGLVGVARAF